MKTMNIAVMAHDNKKELMVQFCIAYCGILSEHPICATATTGRMVAEATGLPVNLYLTAAQGGSQQIKSRIAYNEIDLVLFFRDPSREDDDKEVMDILRACDQHSIPVASNVATAEVLIQGLRRGDFGWRDIVNPKK
jgi:methylglyoxal synthase